MPKTRIEAFSDGVLAIVITLLVLELHVPNVGTALENRALLTSLLHLPPHSWLTSLVFWCVRCGGSRITTLSTILCMLTKRCFGATTCFSYGYILAVSDSTIGQVSGAARGYGALWRDWFLVHGH